MNFKKNATLTFITDQVVPGSGGSAVVINATKEAQLSLTGNSAYIDVDFILSAAMDSGTVITTKLYREDVLVKTISSSVGALAASGTTRISDSMILKSDYAVITISLVSNAATGYTVSVFGTALEAEVTEITTANSANSPASCDFTIGAEAADEILVTCQLKDIVGANLTENANVNVYFTDDAVGTTLKPLATSVVATTGLQTVVNTAKGNIDITTTATGSFSLTLKDSVGADTYFMNVVLPNGVATSTVITFAP